MTNQMEFALVFTGRTDSLKAAAQDAKSSIASVSNEAGQSASSIKVHTAALEKDAAATLKAAEASRTLAADERRIANYANWFGATGGNTAMAANAAAVETVNAKLVQQAAAADRATAANRRLHAVNQNSAQSFHAANLGYQAQDIMVQAAMGTPSWMVGIQQGMQMAPVIASMERPVAGLAAAFASLVRPISLVTVGLSAGVAALIQYFTTAEDGATKTNELFDRQNEVIRRSAAYWGEATPALKAYAEQLDRVKQGSEVREAGGIIAVRELEELGGKLDGIRDKAISAASSLRAQPGTDDTVRALGYAWSDLNDRVKAGTATVADFNHLKTTLAESLQQHANPALKSFSESVDEITASFYRSFTAAQKARSEWYAAVAGGTNVQDIVAGSTFSEGGKVYQADQFVPRNPALPTRRPLIELEGMPNETKASEAAARSYRDIVKGAKDRIEQMRLEAVVSGQTGTAAQRLRFELDLLQEVQDKGRKITPEQRKEIERLGAAYETAARQAASARLLSDAQFDRDQLLRSSGDQKIASQLRGAGLPVDLNSYEAGIIRANEALRKQVSAWENIRDTGRDAIDAITGSALSGFKDIEDVLSGIAKDFVKEMAQLGISNPLKNAIYGDQLPTINNVGGIGGFFSALFGGANPASGATISTQGMTITASSVAISFDQGVTE